MSEKLIKILDKINSANEYSGFCYRRDACRELEPFLNELSSSIQTVIDVQSWLCDVPPEKQYENVNEKIKWLIEQNQKNLHLQMVAKQMFNALTKVTSEFSQMMIDEYSHDPNKDADIIEAQICIQKYKDIK